MTDRPAVNAIVQRDAGQGRPFRHVGLSPARSGVAGDEDVTALADHDHVFTDGIAVEQQRTRGERRGERALVAR